MPKAISSVLDAATKVDVANRFWPKVNKDGPTRIRKLGKCWEWMAAKHNAGYGMIGVRSSSTNRPVLSHRVSWELAHGPVPKGMHVLHKCDNKLCVRPSHLYPGTPKQNGEDAASRGQSTRGVRNPMVKLTEGDVVEIHNLLRTLNVPRRVIGEMFGVTSTAIDAIAWGKTWGWLRPRDNA